MICGEGYYLKNSFQGCWFGLPYSKMQKKQRFIFYYPRVNGIDVARVISGYRDLESFFI